MNRKECAGLFKKLMMLLIAVSMTISMLPASALAKEDLYVTDVSFLDKDDIGEEAYTFYKGFNDKFYVASGSRIRFTFNNGDEKILRVNSGAYIGEGLDENSNPAEFGAKLMSLDDPDGLNMFVLLSVDDKNQVVVSDLSTDKDYPLYTRKVLDLSDQTAPIETLQPGKTKIDQGESSIAKYYRIDPDAFLDADKNGGLIQLVTKGGIESVVDPALAIYDQNGQKLVVSTEKNWDDIDQYLLYAMKKGQSVILAAHTKSNETPVVYRVNVTKKNRIHSIDTSKTVVYPQFRANEWAVSDMVLQAVFDDGSKGIIMPEDWYEDSTLYPFGQVYAKQDADSFVLESVLDNADFFEDKSALARDEDVYVWTSEKVATKTFTDGDLEELPYGEDIALGAGETKAFKIAGTRRLQFNADSYDVRAYFLTELDAVGGSRVLQDGMIATFTEEEAKGYDYVLMKNYSSEDTTFNFTQREGIKKIEDAGTVYYPQLGQGTLRAKVTYGDDSSREFEDEIINMHGNIYAFIEGVGTIWIVEPDEAGGSYTLVADTWESDKGLYADDVQEADVNKIPIQDVRIFEKADTAFGDKITVKSDQVAYIALPFEKDVYVTASRGDISAHFYVWNGAEGINFDSGSFYSSEDDREYQVTLEDEEGEFAIVEIDNESDADGAITFDRIQKYQEPEWNWSEDLSSAKAVFTDEEGKTKTVDAEIESDITALPEGDKPGVRTYTAYVLVDFGDYYYYDTKDVPIPVEDFNQADLEKAQEVSALIAGMDEEDEESIAAVRAAYDKLTEGQKKLVTDYFKLVIAEILMDVRAGAKEVGEMMLALNKNSTAEEVAKVRAIYDELDVYQQNAILQKAKDNLVMHEKRILREQALIDEENQEASEEVAMKINALTGDSDAKAVKEAYDAYNKLTKAQKELVDEDAVMKLMTAAASAGLDKGTTFTVGALKYKVTGILQVAVTGAKKKTASYTVPASVVNPAGSISYKVTAISNKAFAKNKKLKVFTVGKNVKTIGSQAFAGDVKLKKIVFKGTALKKIGAKAFKGVKTIKVKAPKKVAKKYKKLVKKAKAKKVK